MLPSRRLYNAPRRAQTLEFLEPIQETSSKQSNAWGIYLASAQQFDAELKSRFDGDLDVILIVAALLAGLLAQFCASTVDLLQKSGDDKTLEVLISISQQLRNITTPQSIEATLEDFTATPSALRVNFFLFTGLAISVVVVFLAMGAKRWVRDYALGISRIASLEDQAYSRQFRYEGLIDWKLPEFINLLYSLVHFALLCFFIGITDYLVGSNFIVAGASIAVYSIGVLVYSLTTLCAAIFATCPYKTPLARGISRLFANPVLLLLGNGAISAALSLPLWGKTVLGCPFPNAGMSTSTFHETIKMLAQKARILTLLIKRWASSTIINRHLTSLHSPNTLPSPARSESSLVSKHSIVLRYKGLEWLLENAAHGRNWQENYWCILKEAITVPVHQYPYAFQYPTHPCWQNTIESLMKEDNQVALTTADYTLAAAAILLITPRIEGGESNGSSSASHHQQLTKLAAKFRQQPKADPESGIIEYHSIWASILTLHFSHAGQINSSLSELYTSITALGIHNSIHIPDDLHLILLRSLNRWRRSANNSSVSSLMDQVTSALCSLIRLQSNCWRESTERLINSTLDESIHLQLDESYPLIRLRADLELAVLMATGKELCHSQSSSHIQSLKAIESCVSSLSSYIQRLNTTQPSNFGNIQQFLTGITWGLMDRIPYANANELRYIIRSLITLFEFCLAKDSLADFRPHETALRLVSWLWNSHSDLKWIMHDNNLVQELVRLFIVVLNATFESNNPTPSKLVADARNPGTLLRSLVQVLNNVSTDSTSDDLRDVLAELMVPEHGLGFFFSGLVQAFDKLPKVEIQQCVDLLQPPTLKYMAAACFKCLSRTYDIDVDDFLDHHTRMRALESTLRFVFQYDRLSHESPEFKLAQDLLCHKDSSFRQQGFLLWKMILENVLITGLPRATHVSDPPHEHEHDRFILKTYLCEPLYPLLSIHNDNIHEHMDSLMKIILRITRGRNYATIVTLSEYNLFNWLDSQSQDTAHFLAISEFFSTLFLSHSQRLNSLEDLNKREKIIIDFLSTSRLYTEVQQIPELMAQWLRAHPQHIIGEPRPLIDWYCGNDLLRFVQDTFQLYDYDPRLQMDNWEDVRFRRKQMLQESGLLWKPNKITWETKGALLKERINDLAIPEDR